MEPFDTPHQSARLGMNIAIAVVSFVLVFGLGYWAYYTWAAPAYEEVRHETYEHSTAFIHGKIQSLNRYRMDYERAGKTHRDAIARMARHEASTLPDQYLPDDLRAWLTSLDIQEVSK